MSTEFIPTSYEQWHHCITVSCKQPLTPAFIESRIAALNNLKDHSTRRFIELYGEHQRQNTLAWFERSKS